MHGGVCKRDERRADYDQRNGVNPNVVVVEAERAEDGGAGHLDV